MTAEIGCDDLKGGNLPSDRPETDVSDKVVWSVYESCNPDCLAVRGIYD